MSDCSPTFLLSNSKCRREACPTRAQTRSRNREAGDETAPDTPSQNLPYRRLGGFALRATDLLFWESWQNGGMRKTASCEQAGAEADTLAPAPKRANLHLENVVRLHEIPHKKAGCRIAEILRLNHLQPSPRNPCASLPHKASAVEARYSETEDYPNHNLSLRP